MKHLKSYEKTAYVLPEEHELMRTLRHMLFSYFNRYNTVSVTKIPNTNLISIKVYTGPKNLKAKKFMDVLEYIGIGRKLDFSSTVEKLVELLDIFKKNKIDTISELISKSKKYNI